ncbi:MAG: hypothetical protein RLZZ69_2792, partial [Cyanobacteriota bacterium]
IILPDIKATISDRNLDERSKKAFLVFYFLEKKIPQDNFLGHFR